MNIGVPKETAANERRVAVTPDGAGGARLVASAADVLGQSDVVLKVQPPSAQEARLCREASALVALFQPSAERETVSQLAARNVTAFSLALLPRITRAQPMDVLSSQATVAGYKAVLLAASATARRLGAVVTAFDVRAAAKEQVESLGAKFLEMQLGEQAEAAGGYAKQLSEDTHRRELAFLAQQVKDADIVITTAAIPGKRAPILITAEAVQGMKPGAVIVDLAAETGGNCEVTEPGSEVRRNGVVILGPLNLPSTLPLHASQMYARNISSFLLHVARDGKLVVDFDDEIIRETCVTHAGEVRKT